MFKKAAALGLGAFLLAAPMFANDDGDAPKGIPHQDHVFLIMMENHGYQQVFGNPNEPYLNSLISNKNVSLATNYFAIGHPSLTNYLEVVGGSNFGVRSDNSPSWHDKTCTTNIASGIVNADDFGAPAILPPSTIKTESSNVCPIAGSGKDAETPAVDNWNEVALPQFAFLADIDGVKSVPSEYTQGKTIADQLVRAGKSWKSYQESLPGAGADGVNNSDGFYSDLVPFTPSFTGEALLKLYAVKHNPFAYFRDVQEGTNTESSLKNMAGFEGARGLFEDLAAGNVPNFSFIVPNQCNDQHGRGNGGPQCDFDPSTIGTQEGLNPALIYLGDLAIRNLVMAIHDSPAWKEGHNSIVIVWDENDYSGTPAAQDGLFPSQNLSLIHI